jgi:D-alanyl-lipoteichoic acid acyltransferase DltB (MBOAT superfamily)
MLFNSLDFLCFFAIVYIAYCILPFRGQNWMLLVAGYVFYGWWDVRFLFLIACSTTVDFTIGLLLVNAKMPLRERWTASLFLIGAAIVFLCPNWSALRLKTFEIVHFFTFRPFGLEVVAGSIVFVLAGNLLIDLSTRLPEERRRRLLIVSSIFVNLAFLGFFKYFNFFIGSAEDAFRIFGIDPSGLRLSVVLPVGISFYTFQSLSYTIDIYRCKLVPTTKFWNFALFVAYFPPMVAGPIERGRHLLPQLLSPRRINLQQSMDGLVLVLLGLFKKIAIADGIAPSVNSVFNSSGVISQIDVALATLLFAFQIFCDFSGYSDIARGVSKLLGINLLLNFNLPYFSKNPSEFWQRWHISLSSWLRDYLYIPLGGNRHGRLLTYRNLMLTMLLGGLWHGAAWNYVLWGGYQGALLCGHRLLTRHDEQPLMLGTRVNACRSPGVNSWRRVIHFLLASLSPSLKIGCFFLFCCYGWLLFCAHSFQQIIQFTAVLFGFGVNVAPIISKPTLSALMGIPILVLLQLCDYRAGRLESFQRWRPSFQGVLYATLFFVMIMGTSNAPVQFIYFQF